LFVVTLPVTQTSGILYDFLFGFDYDNASEFIGFARETVLVLSGTFFGNEILNKVLFFIFWLLLGTAVYFIAVSITGSITAANEVRSEMHYMNLHKRELEAQVGKRIALHVLGGLNWLFYWILFLRILMPYISSLAQISVSNFSNLQGLFYGLAAFLLLMLSLHGHVIFLRFLLLRPRVFGGWEAELESSH